MGSWELRLVLSVAEVMTINLHVSLVRRLHNPPIDVGKAKLAGKGANGQINEYSRHHAVIALAKAHPPLMRPANSDRTREVTLYSAQPWHRKLNRA